MEEGEGTVTRRAVLEAFVQKRKVDRGRKKRKGMAA